MSTQHTLGSWRVSGCRMRQLSGPDNYLIEHGGEDEGSPLVAEVYSDGGRLPVEANARLIAAAPSLLKALKAIRPWLGKAVADDAFRHCALPLGGSKALRQAEIAVAEAEGELRK